MNTAKVTLTSTILAAALGLALGLAAAPAMADKPIGGVHGPHGDDEDATLFTVSLDFLIVEDGSGFELTRVEDCEGTTDILANPGLTVDFEPGCSVVMTVDFPDPGTEETLSLFRLEAKIKGSGVTEIRLNFTTEEVLTDGTTIYNTDRLFALIEPPLGEPGVFVLDPVTDDEGEFLTKGHQPGKGARTEQPLFIGEFTYTPM